MPSRSSVKPLRACVKRAPIATPASFKYTASVRKPLRVCRSASVAKETVRCAWTTVAMTSRARRIGRARVTCCSFTSDRLQTSGLNRSGDVLDFRPNAEQVPTPDLADLFLGVSATHQFQRDVEGFRRAVPARHTPAAIEVG